MAKIESNQAILRPFNMSGLSGPLAPIAKTNGLVFVYTAEITESIDVVYESSGDLVHTNEQFMVYKGTANRKISIGSIRFTADTLENAQYMLAAIHFFRVYSLMDFGSGKSGRPPSPMWFSSYGSLIFKDVPVLLDAASIRFPDDKDYVQYSKAAFNTGGGQSFRQSGSSDPFIPEADFSTPTGGGDVVWLPAIIEISGVSLIVQHTPAYWLKSFSLNDFYSKGMVEGRETGSVADTRPPTPAMLGTSLGGGQSSGISSQSLINSSMPRLDIGSFSPMLELSKRSAGSILQNFDLPQGLKAFKGGII